MKPGQASTPADAVQLQAGARRKRVVANILAEQHADPTGARWERLEAADMERRAAELLDAAPLAPEGLIVGRGGEIVPVGDDADSLPGLVETVRDRPDLLTANASLDRMKLAGESGATNLALDAAETVRGRNSLEKMLAHQLAVTHKLGMELAAKAGHFLSHVSSWNPQGRQQVSSIEGARLAAASARMFDAYQRGLLTLQRIRSHGKQTIVVQHVNVNGGGQAVVAGALRTGRGRHRGKGATPK
ncbi:hypothetical protein [Desertibaculum subflavum]|uniref:hypothetical protein n=1 Tax=Desertibaculum subflavum TaxID=2268458 RepID=UPI000E669E8A